MHLVKRFFGSLVAKPLSSDESAFVTANLNSGEMEIWNRFSTADQRHSYGVAKRVEESLGTERRETKTPEEIALAAALMHDCGKVESDLGTFSRVLATLVWIVVPQSKARSLEGSSYIGRIASYRLHPEIGGRLLQEAGSNEFVYRWAQDHHKPKDRWFGDPSVCQILKDCDDD